MNLFRLNKINSILFIHHKNGLFNNVRYNFCKKTLSSNDKMKLIIDKDMKNYKENEEDIKFVEDKTLPLTRISHFIRFPIYFGIPILIWSNPLTSLYYTSFMAANYYLIFLTTFDATNFFSLAINEYNLVMNNNLSKEKKEEFIKMKRQIIQKRLNLMIFYFGVLFYSAYLAQSNENLNTSLALLFFINLYLFIKISYHITLYGLNKITYTRKTKNHSMNMLLILGILTINYQKERFIKNNLVYTS
jgi:hypothetical protein